MSGSVPQDGDGVVFDPEAVHAKYLAERDKRLGPRPRRHPGPERDEHFARYRRTRSRRSSSGSPSPTTSTS